MLSFLTVALRVLPIGQVRTRNVFEILVERLENIFGTIFTKRVSGKRSNDRHGKAGMNEKLKRIKK